MRKIATTFKGVSVYVGYDYPEHISDIGIGLLCSGWVPEVDNLQEFVESIPFKGTDEQFCEDLQTAFDKAIPNKGSLVFIGGHVVCAGVSGEVKSDADVKFEMYKLMGV